MLFSEEAHGFATSSWIHFRVHVLHGIGAGLFLSTNTMPQEVGTSQSQALHGQVRQGDQGGFRPGQVRSFLDGSTQSIPYVLSDNPRSLPLSFTEILSVYNCESCHTAEISAGFNFVS